MSAVLFILCLLCHSPNIIFRRGAPLSLNARGKRGYHYLFPPPLTNLDNSGVYRHYSKKQKKCAPVRDLHFRNAMDNKTQRYLIMQKIKIYTKKKTHGGVAAFRSTKFPSARLKCVAVWEPDRPALLCAVACSVLLKRLSED